MEPGSTQCEEGTSSYHEQTRNNLLAYTLSCRDLQTVFIQANCFSTKLLEWQDALINIWWTIIKPKFSLELTSLLMKHRTTVISLVSERLKITIYSKDDKFSQMSQREKNTRD
ncbi:hypothetical protein KIN20_005789 [Parelaphostrongylus tenuis]|uniref:Uncharacterized protein n=1 Tax=Parelaphostrongylus tenuis TaxID=148309 RepID=A0AAD5QHS6_PARTN|nr:hypothetical protein KIN20_005789 [Parelaphostrongylus tenuis]